MHRISFGQLFSFLFVLFAALLAASTLFAWTGPTATAPGGNVSAPINVGTTDQVKNAGLSVNSLAVFGTQYVQNKLGIGTASPVVALDVAGTMRLGNGGEVCQGVTAGAMRYSGGALQYCNGTAWTAIASGGSSQWTTNGSNIYYSSGNVGIGTVSPSYPLTVAGGARGNWAAVIDWPASNSNQYGLLVGTASDGYSQFQNAAGYYTILANTSWGVQTNGNLLAPAFYDSDNTAYNVDPASTSNFNTVKANSYYAQGNAGVSFSTGGCTSYDTYYTQGLLTAYGNAQYLCGADIAEPYPIDGAISVERGLIVAPSDTTASYDLTVTNPAAGESTTTSYTMTVAKMHVAQPGEREQIYGAVPTRAFDINHGMNESGMQLVSLAGHVPVHVTHEHGPIAIGDPITLSDTKAGYGTKATTPGKILGYALAPYDGTGSDMIEVSMAVQEWQPAGEICASDNSGSTCITKSQLDALLQKIGQ